MEWVIDGESSVRSVVESDQVGEFSSGRVERSLIVIRLVAPAEPMEATEGSCRQRGRCTPDLAASRVCTRRQLTYFRSDEPLPLVDACRNDGASQFQQPVLRSRTTARITAIVRIVRA